METTVGFWGPSYNTDYSIAGSILGSPYYQLPSRVPPIPVVGTSKI